MQTYGVGEFWKTCSYQYNKVFIVLTDPLHIFLHYLLIMTLLLLNFWHECVLCSLLSFVIPYLNWNSLWSYNFHFCFQIRAKITCLLICATPSTARRSPTAKTAIGSSCGTATETFRTVPARRRTSSGLSAARRKSGLCRLIHLVLHSNNY